MKSKEEGLCILRIPHLSRLLKRAHFPEVKPGRDPVRGNLRTVLSFRAGKVPVMSPRRQGSPRLPIAGVIPQVPETKPQKHTVSGRYEGAVGGYRIELRVDVDGVCPMQRLSGDFFRESGATTLYYGSFIVHEVEVKVTASKVTLRGLGSFSFEASAPEVQVTIPRRAVSRRRASAALQFYTVSGTPGIPYSCEFVSSFFRTVCIETDRVSDVTTPGFSNYDTGMLPSGGPVRVLDVAGAYAEAGIEMISSAGGNVVDISAAGENATWSNAELHAAMVSHFTLYHDLPRWAVWQLVARQHDLGAPCTALCSTRRGNKDRGALCFMRASAATPLRNNVCSSTPVSMSWAIVLTCFIRGRNRWVHLHGPTGPKPCHG